MFLSFTLYPFNPVILKKYKPDKKYFTNLSGMGAGGGNKEIFSNWPFIDFQVNSELQGLPFSLV
jgi:hypothetical protein